MKALRFKEMSAKTAKHAALFLGSVVEIGVILGGEETLVLCDGGLRHDLEKRASRDLYETSKVILGVRDVPSVKFEEIETAARRI